jgi:hypothetical protein
LNSDKYKGEKLLSHKAKTLPAQVTDEVFDKAVKDHASDLTAIESKDTGLVDNENSSLIGVPTETLPINTPLPCTVYVKMGNKFLVFRRQGEKLNYKTALEMCKNGSGIVHIHRAFWQMFMKSLEDMKVDKKGASPEMQAMHMRQLLLAYGQELERKLREPKKPIFDKLQNLSGAISEKIQADPKIAASLLRPTPDTMFYFVNHSVNCAVYATLIGLKLKLTSEELKTLTYAAMVHDIGNLFLPKRILYKRSTLSQDDEQIMMTHPRKGAELLQSLQAPPEVVRAALEHQERIDGKGYPQGLFDDEISLFAKIISIADVFDALTSNRPYRAAVPSAKAIEVMRSMEGAFAPEFLSMVDPSKK